MVTQTEADKQAGDPPAAVNSGPLIALRRLRVKDFRRIKQLDVEFPSNVRVICFVGPNGSGKSALLSKLAWSLCQHTREPAPDLPKGPWVRPNAGNLVRHRMTSEIRTGQPAYLIRTDWDMNEERVAYTDCARSGLEVQLAPGFFPDGGPIDRFRLNNLFEGFWTSYSRPDDPIARSILLVRPADRWEQPNYEEPDKLIVPPPFSMRWIDQRAFAFKVERWGFELEQFIYSMIVERGLQRPLPTNAAQLFEQIYSELTGQSFSISVQPWPFVRAGLGPTEELSGLSAGEMDILVTAGLILGQAVALKMTTSELELNPHGYVFIDEIDCHLHPQWQQKVIPILTKAFPNVTFVITTHSPFVLRSLSKENSRIIRLPDGEVFNTDFNAWQIDDILGAVFEVPSPWSQGISDELGKLEALLKDPTKEDDALRLYRELTSHQSTGLKAECRRLAGLFATAGFMEKLVQGNGAVGSGEGSMASIPEAPGEDG